MISNVSQTISNKIATGVPLTTLEAWMSGIDAPSWLTPLTDAVDDLGRNRLFKSGAAGSNGEDADGIYTLNMRGLSKALIRLDSTEESQDQGYNSPRNHKEYDGSLNNVSGESFSYTIEFGRGGSQTMGEAGLTETQVLTGGGSDDIINGGFGDDIIAGNRGDDIIKAGAGKDFVKGGAGSDVIDGGDGNDYLVGDYADSDRHESRAGDRGGETWNDLIRGGAGDDFIFGNQGNDTLHGNDGNDVLEGGTGEDRLFDDGDGNDLLQGGAGRDHLFIGTGINLADGGEGSGDHVNANRAAVSSGLVIDAVGATSLLGIGLNAAAIETSIDGRQTAFVISAGPDSNEAFLTADYGETNLLGLRGTFEDVAASGSIANATLVINAEEILGSNQDDTFNGSDMNDRFFGADGSDEVFGGKGDDHLNGQKGDDEIRGEAGNDVLRGEAGDDKLWGLNDEDQLFGGEGNDFLHGGAENDKLFGQEGDDVLHGGAGEDMLYGGEGNDTLRGAAGSDRFIFKDDFGSDKITDFNHEGVVDLIDLRNISDPDISTMSLVNDGNNMVIKIGDNSITVENMNTSDFDQDAWILS